MITGNNYLLLNHGIKNHGVVSIRYLNEIL